MDASTFDKEAYAKEHTHKSWVSLFWRMKVFL